MWQCLDGQHISFYLQEKTEPGGTLGQVIENLAIAPVRRLLCPHLANREKNELLAMEMVNSINLTTCFVYVREKKESSLLEPKSLGYIGVGGWLGGGEGHNHNQHHDRGATL